MISQEIIETIAWTLKGSSLEDIAFLENAGVLYFSRFSPKSLIPTSSVVQLIQGIYETQPEQARAILRNRVFTTAVPTEMCLGMVSVAAKRLTSQVLPIDHKLNLSFQWTEIPSLHSPIVQRPPVLEKQVDFSSNRDFMQLAQALVADVPRSQKLYQSDRPIAALLVSEKNKILSWGINSNSKNKTLHAEVKMIQSFYQATKAPLPSHSRIYTTLKPCKMCSGMIWNTAQDLHSLKVYFGETDPGPKGKQTVLTLGTPERRRASRNESELHLAIEHPLDKD